MNLPELLTRADELGLAASALACLDRCMPLLGGGDDALRPLWAHLARTASGAGEEEPDGWAALLAAARDDLPKAPDTPGGPAAEAAALTRGMLDSAPSTLGPDTAAWADACSLTALHAHALVDPFPTRTPIPVLRETPDAPAAPLVAAELRHQAHVLRLLMDHGPQSLRQVLESSTESRRVLQAALSRSRRGR